jgi:hypothetical protein
MLLHITVVFTSTLVLSGEFIPSLVIALTYWAIDNLKVTLQAKYSNKQIERFIIDQVLHFLIIAAIWFSYFNIWNKLNITITTPFINYHFSLILLAYLWPIYPVGFLITGKSIIRFADHNSNLRSEYVLVGTMMSYAIAIITGVGVKFLLNI